MLLKLKARYFAVIKYTCIDEFIIFVNNDTYIDSKFGGAAPPLLPL